MNSKMYLILAVYVIGLFVSPLLAGEQLADEPLWKTVPPPQAMPKASKTGNLKVNNISLYYASYGKGTPVILLHGGLGHSDFWSNQVLELQKNHQVIVIDSRGHGRSSSDKQTYSYHLMASDVLGVMDALSISKADILGWSDGGIIGLDIAINNPKRLNRLMVFGTNYNLSAIKETVHHDPVFGQYVGVSATDYAKLSTTKEDFDGFVGAISKMWATEPNYSKDQLKSIKVPVLILQAEQDEAIKNEHAKEMAALISGAKLVMLPGLSHFAPWQDPKAFNLQITRFLDTQK